MIYDCQTCHKKLVIEPGAKTKCGTCNLYHTGVLSNEKNETIAGATSDVIAVETPKRSVRDMW